MYRLKSTADISFLLGARLEQVCVSVTVLKLNFDRDVKLEILSDFAVSKPGLAYVKFIDSIQDASALFPLLGDVISEATVTPDGGLEVTFTAGARLELFDTSDQYESFLITNGDQLIVV
jgi:hypothetical protein